MIPSLQLKKKKKFWLLIIGDGVYSLLTWLIRPYNFPKKSDAVPNKKF